MLLEAVLPGRMVVVPVNNGSSEAAEDVGAGIINDTSPLEEAGAAPASPLGGSAGIIKVDMDIFQEV